MRWAWIVALLGSGCTASDDATTAYLGVEAVREAPARVPQASEHVVAEVDAVSAPAGDPHPTEAALPPAVARFALRRGETLHHFARWSGLPVEVVAEVSALDLDGRYAVGTEVRLPLGEEAAAEVREARDRHHLRRLEGYLAARGGALGSAFVRVRTGDTAWAIAKEAQGLPLWVLESYNPAVDLDHLRPGQELHVPVLADRVVVAAE